MIWRCVWALAILAGLSAPLCAETVYLNTGESIKGTILRADEETIAIETEKGFGVIQVQRSDIVNIQFDQNERGISRKFGLGFFHRFVPLVVEASGQAFGLDALALRMWFSRAVAVDLLLGFTSISTGNVKTYEAMTVEGRGSWVFSRQGSVNLYLGGGFGILNLTRSAGSPEETGTSLSAFLGTEMFPPGMPNLGIATEIALNLQEVGEGANAIKSTAIVPAVAVRYYF